MARWIRFAHRNVTQFGTLSGETITVYDGDMFDNPLATGQTLNVNDVTVLTPSNPSKMLALWNNFHTRAIIEGLTQPEHPLYFIKVSSCFNTHGQNIQQPQNYDGPVVFEGELGIVIGKACSNISADNVDDYIFGYTCVNDVTARGVMKADPSFVQWTRAKGYDTFGVFGPTITTDVEPDELVVRTLVNGEEKQNYPVTDMFFRPREIVSHLSQDMTLYPGDVIACGTSIGAEPMPHGCTVEIMIDGVGKLSNRFVEAEHPALPTDQIEPSDAVM